LFEKCTKRKDLEGDNLTKIEVLKKQNPEIESTFKGF
jgi:hypothetical protein